MENFVQFQLNEPAAYLFGEETWTVLVNENEIYQNLLEKCEEKKALVNWENSATESIAKYLRCSQCHSLLLTPINPDANLEKLVLKCTECNKEDSFLELVEVAAESYHGISDRELARGGELDLWDCPECGKRTFLYSEDICLACGESLTYNECFICGNSLTPEEQDLGGLCSYHNDVDSKDD